MGSMRKGLAFVLAATMLVVLGCGITGSTEGRVEGGPSQEVKKDPVKIQFWHGMADDSAHGKVLAQLIHEYNQSQAGVIVEATYQGAYTDLEKKLYAAVQAKAPPQVVQATDSMLVKLVAEQAVQALDAHIPAAEKADYPAGLLAAQTFKDGQESKLYGLPFNKSMIILVYNKMLVPTAPKTWEEFKRIAAEVSVKNERYGTAFNADAYYFGTHFGQTAGAWLNADETKVAFNGPEGVAALTLITDMVKNGSAIQVQPKTYQSDYFNQGRAAMIATTSASLAYLKPANGDPWGVAHLYAGPANDRVPLSGANVVMVSGLKPEEAQAAAHFMLWLTGKEATLKWATGKTGYMPVRTSAVETQEWKEFVKANPEYEVLGASINKGVTQPNNRKWADIQKFLTIAVEKAVLGTDPKAALDEAAAKANEFLSKP